MTITGTTTAEGTMNVPSMIAFSAFLNRVRTWYRRRRASRQARAAFMNTVHLDDRILDDMGVTREEVLWAASLPIEQNAALALRVRAARRRSAR